MTKKPKAVREVALARKNMDMDVHKLELAREILGARTDTEAVDRALDYVIFQSDVLSAVERLGEVEPFEDVFNRGTRRK
jgi:hypothetical protein